MAREQEMEIVKPRDPATLAAIDHLVRKQLDAASAALIDGLNGAALCKYSVSRDYSSWSIDFDQLCRDPQVASDLQAA